jgi:hypothetical protein
MRAGTIILTLALALSALPGHAKEAAGADKAAKPPTAVRLTEEESRTLGDEARRKSDAQQRAWDAKTKSITRGICSGC